MAVAGLIRRLRQRVTGHVVCMPALALEGCEHRCPLLLFRKMEKETPIAPDAVAFAELLTVALIHVHFVHAAPGAEAEITVCLLFRSPRSAVRIPDGRFVGQSALHQTVELFVKVIVRAWHIVG